VTKIEDRDIAIKMAREALTKHYFVFDTETTGINANDEIVQFSILERNAGKEIRRFTTLVKPSIPVKEDAFAIHHISNKLLENAPSMRDVYTEIPTLLHLVGYNIAFDSQMLVNSLRAARAPVFYIDDTRIQPYDVMLICAQYRGRWDDTHHGYKWPKLCIACETFGITIDDDLELHDSMTDVIMTERLLNYVAEQKLSTEPFLERI